MNQLNIVTDKHGIEIIKGQVVTVFQKEEIREAKVIEPFFDCPTKNKPGHWVDIDFGDGVQGIMSYILKVKNNE